ADVEGAEEAERFVLGFAALGELVDDCPFEEWVKNYGDYEAVGFVQNLSLIAARLHPEKGSNQTCALPVEEFTECEDPAASGRDVDRGAPDGRTGRDRYIQDALEECRIEKENLVSLEEVD
ncbi:15345_t:CDS:2, partial [Acaulospora colombiana]